VRIDLKKGEANMLISDEELAKRRKDLEAAGGFKYPASQTPWQEIQRSVVGQMGTGMVLENAVKYQKIDETKGIPRDNH
jgi:dihydroxy-acid dehydratase